MKEKIKAIFAKYGAGVHQGEYVTRKELEDILLQLTDDSSPKAQPTRRSIG